MSMLTRFADIMKANVNSVFEKWEDPVKMVDQTMRNLQSDLAKVKAETASVMADEKAAERKVNECLDEMQKLQKYGEKALIAGNEEDARAFLVKKHEMDTKLLTLQQGLDVARDNSTKMRQMYDKLQADITTLSERSSMIKAKAATAKAHEHMNKVSGSTIASSRSVADFERWEAKVDKKLDTANAVTQLSEPPMDSVGKLKEKYTSPEIEISDEEITEEILAMKEALGL